MLKQIPEQFESIFSSKYQCGLGRFLVLSTVQCRSKMEIRSGSLQPTIRNCLEHFLEIYQRRLIAKLNAYEFNMSPLRFGHSYLEDRMQKNKNKRRIQFLGRIVFEVPQGSILGSLLFNIFSCDLFLIVKSTDIANYADETRHTTLESQLRKYFKNSKTLQNGSYNGLMVTK